MRMETMFRKSASLLLAACLSTFAGAGFAGTSVVPASDRMIVTQASPDQDPKSPPDCKKYPKDTRCKKK